MNAGWQPVRIHLHIHAASSTIHLHLMSVNVLFSDIYRIESQPLKQAKVTFNVSDYIPSDLGEN